MAGIIAIIIVMVVINGFMVYAIYRAWERVNDKINKFFLDKTSNLSFGEATVKKEEVLVEPKEEKVIVKTQPVYVAPSTVTNTVYKSKGFKEDYKKLKQNMSFDKDAVISKVVNELDDKTGIIGKTAISLNNSFTFDTVFKLSTLSSNEQLKILKESFNENELKLLNDYLSKNNKAFSSVDFFDYVSQIAKTEDPKFYVKTGWDSDNFDELGDDVVTVHDNDITEGVKIVHKNKLYDYSV